MKRICFVGYLLIYSVSSLSAQNWIWGKQGIIPSNYSAAIYHSSSCISSDNVGNIYTVGGFSDTVSFGPFMLKTQYSSFISDMFLVKYNSSGSVVWAKQSTHLPNDGFGSGTAVTVDKSGNVLVSGTFEGNTNFGSIISSSSTSSGYLLKYNSSGDILWEWHTTQASNSCFINPLSVTTDASGNIFMAGYFHDTVSFGSNTLICSFNYPWGDMFITKFDENGNLLWVKQGIAHNYTSGGWASCVATDAFGNAYLTGFFTDSVTFGTTTLVSNPYSQDSYLVKYDPNGNVLWAKQATQVNNISNSYSYRIAVDAKGYIYLAGGSIDSVIFGTTILPTSYSGSGYLVRYNPDGNVTWAEQPIPIDPISSWAGIAVASDGQENGGGYFLFGTGDLINYNHYIVKFANDTFYYNRYLASVSVITHFDTSGNVSCGSVFAGPNILGMCVDASTKDIYIAGALSDSNVVFGADTLLYKDGSMVAQWQSCCSSFTANACCNESISYGQSVPLAVNTASKYQWFPSTNLSCDTCQNPTASPTSTSEYYVLISNSLGCMSEDSLHINLPDNVFVPNAFSPNGDGENDVLYIKGNSIKSIDFIIYDRWGNKVFESENINNGWNGTYKGQPLNTGTYVYYLSATMFDGKIIEKKGNVALLR